MVEAKHKGLKTPSRRQLRVAEILRHSLAGLLQCFPMRRGDRNIDVMITVTAVSMSPDLKHARVFVRGFHQLALPKDWLHQLRKERGHLRSALNVELKYTPNLHFVEDESFTYANKIETLIAEDHARDAATESE